MTGYDVAEKYIEKVAFLNWITKGLGLLRGGVGTALATKSTWDAAGKALAAVPKVTAVPNAASWLTKDKLRTAGLVGSGMVADRVLFNDKPQNDQYLYGKTAAERYIEKVARFGPAQLGRVFGTPSTGWANMAKGVWGNLTKADIGSRFSEAYKAGKGTKWVSPMAALRATEDVATRGIGIGNQKLLGNVKKGLGVAGTLGVGYAGVQIGKNINKKMMKQVPQEPEVQVVYAQPYPTV